MTSRTRPVLLATAGLSAALLLAGCTSVEEGTASPAPTSSSPEESSSASPSSSSEAEDTGGLEAGLLPADAFGAGATATTLTAEQLEQGAELGESVGELTVTPETCAPAVQGTQPDVEDLGDFAAQSVLVGTTTTVQLLTSGASTGGDVVAALAGAAQACPQATLTSPQIGTATVTFTALEVPDLGDGSAAVAYTTTVTGPDGAAVTIPSLIGVVQDGDRLLTLASLGATGTLDQTGFGPLLQQAFEYQADALD